MTILNDGATKMMQIFRTTAKLPPIVVLHGLPGIGKTTFAQNFPDPVFVQTEDGCPVGLEIATFGLCETYAAVIDALGQLGTQPHDHKTLVLDSLDKLEPLLLAAVCADRGYASIESPGYGKGWVEADRWWLDILRGCEWLRRTRHMTIVLIAHSEIATVNDPRVASYTSISCACTSGRAALVEDSCRPDRLSCHRRHHQERTRRLRQDARTRRWRLDAVAAHRRPAGIRRQEQIRNAGAHRDPAALRFPEHARQVLPAAAGGRNPCCGTRNRNNGES